MHHSRRTFLKFALAGACGFAVYGCRRAALSGASALPPGVDYFTCAMHPSVHLLAPGTCPICGMTLIPVYKKTTVAVAAASAAFTGEEFTIPPARQQEIGVSYATVERRPLRRTLRGVGTVEFDRQRAWAFVARTDGYVKRLFVTSPGELVGAGQKLLTFYSPDLYTAEREYVMLVSMRDEARSPAERETPESLLASARNRLLEWNVSPGEIAALEQSRTPAQEVTLCSPFRGVIKDVAAEQGGNVHTGDKLVEVADLSRVWVWADFYEVEVGALRQGQKVAVTVSAYPGKVFEGTVALIDPFLDEARRTFKLRIDIDNADLHLRPGMYADVQVTLNRPAALAIPLNAVMPTGTRNIVFVDQGDGRLQPRNITLGAEYDGFYEVKEGLSPGERIVASATFLIDAEAQLQGALKGFDQGGSR